LTANIAVQLTIGDYDDWRPVFNKHKQMREEKADIKSERVYCDADNPTEVLLWFETTDTAKTREVLQSEEVKGHMKEAGVVWPPKVHVIT
jgi:hypothetical protein